MAPILNKMQRLLPLFFDIQAVRAMVTWPQFSVTAYGIVSDLFKQGIRPRTLIDVGAHTGQFTIASLNIFEGVGVHAFEPVASCVEKLRANTSGYGNVCVHAVALGAKRERSIFHINSYSLASSLLRVSNKHQSEFSQVAEKETTTIEVYTLDHYFSNSVLAAPVLLKIDVQGVEKLVLEGGKETLKQVDYVLLETSFAPMYVGEPLFPEMLEVMKTCNFQFLRPISFLKSPKSGEILQADILFENRNP